MNELFKKIGIKEILTILMLLLATYITSRLAPLSQDIAVIKTQVSANEARDNNEHPTFATKQDIQDIKNQITRLNDNLDKLIWNRGQ